MMIYRSHVIHEMADVYKNTHFVEGELLLVVECVIDIYIGNLV